MRKTILGLVAIAAVAAPIAFATSANADVARCGGGTSTTTTATFTAWEPADAINQWTNTWQHNFTVTLTEGGVFTGTGTQNGQAAFGYGDGWGAMFRNEPVTITGQMGDDGKITYTETRANPARTWTLTGAQTVENLTNPATTEIKTVSTGGDPVEWKISTPVLTTVTEGYKNHGQFVSELGGGVDAAQACTGMPLTSKKGQQG